MSEHDSDVRRLLERARAVCERSNTALRWADRLAFRSRILLRVCRLGAGEIKRCSSCGKSYRWLDWQHLEIVGESTIAGADVEFRNCTCGSTLAFVVRRE